MAIRALARHRATLALVLLAIFAFFLATAGRLLASPRAALPAGCSNSPQDAQALQASLAAAVAQASQLPGTAHTDWRVQSICQQGDWAYAFIKGFAAGTSAPLPGPSQIALAQRTASGWQTSLPSDAAAYNRALAALPADLLPPAARSLLGQPGPSAAAPVLGPARAYFSGFSLPFPAGESAYVYWHWYPALDFTIGDSGTIRAAKAGTAVFVKGTSTVECGDPPPNWTCWMYANAIVIQSGPTEYAWYLHFAPNTIPAWIHEGVQIPAGADLGEQGRTGWASLPHLHFMVSTWFACCTGSGDGRFPTWPAGSILGVDFNEYTWDQMPYQAVSQNGSSPAPAAPPGPPPATAPAQAQPQPTAAPPPLTTGGTLVACPNPYAVQPGDYLIRIASSCNVNETALVVANPGLNPNLIYVGQLINLPTSLGGQPDPNAAAPTAPPPVATAVSPVAGSPCSGMHVILPGETLFQIGAACGLTWQQLAAANGIGYPYLIYAGQSLQYP